MKKIKIDVVRRRISKDLRTLHQILNENRSGVIIDVDGLLAAVNEADRKGKNDIWEYGVSGVHIRVVMPQNTLPVNCGDFIDVFVDLDIKGRVDSAERELITDLILNLKICASGGANVCSWHFDRHIGEGGDEQGEAHPLYHFQHGGHAMKPYATNLGANLLLPSPRIPFPPMDAILAFDFVISNFSGPCWMSLRDDPAYCRLLREAQAQHWKPYMEKLASWWTDSTKDKLCTSLWPHLIP